jgi:mono/diheme cytochrome c family protein
MHRRILIAVVCLAVASAALLGVGGLWAQADEKSAAEVPAKIPDEEKRRKNPQEATPQSIANGKQIFSSQCAMCHGATGDGKGDLAARIGYKMADFTDPKAQAARTDGEYFYILTHGRGKMSGEGERLSEAIRWNLVNYIRTLVPQGAS